MGKVIDIPGQERYVFNRARFDDVVKQISNLSDQDRQKLKPYYNAMDLYQRGVMYGNRGQLLKAMSLVDDDDLFRYHLQADRKQIQRLTQLIEEEPDNLQYLLNLAHSFYQIEKYEQSMEILQIVLEKNPNLSFANLYMGYNLLETGGKEEALTYFKKTAKNDPQQMATVMREIGLVSLLKEIDKNPKDPILQRSLAEYYNLKKEYLKSLEIFTSVATTRSNELEDIADHCIQLPWIRRSKRSSNVWRPL
jgi:tetratricopeptide (TPR) repeat protein